MIFADAVFEANSVNSIVKNTSPTIRKSVPVAPVIWIIQEEKCPERPVLNKIFPRERPEPNNNKAGQSIWEVSLLVNIFLLELKGNKNKRDAKNIPTIGAEILFFKNSEKEDC